MATLTYAHEFPCVQLKTGRKMSKISVDSEASNVSNGSVDPSIMDLFVGVAASKIADRVMQILEERGFSSALSSAPRPKKLVMTNKSTRQDTHQDLNHASAHYPNGSLYLPELDYLVWVTRLRGEFRRGFYNVQGAMKLNAANTTNANSSTTGAPDSMIYGYEITGYQGKSHDVIFPSAALFRDVSIQYGVEPKQDYRLNPRAQSFYMKGVMDAGNANAPYKTNASCYTLNLLTPLSDAVLDATEQYWQDITPEEEAVRIISRADMLRLIAEFRDGIKTPANVPWKVPGVCELTDLSALLNPKRVTVEGYADAEELVSEWDE